MALTYSFDIPILSCLEKGISYQLSEISGKPHERSGEIHRFRLRITLLNALIGNIAGKNACRQSRNHR